jgi:hypothetical protein
MSKSYSNTNRVVCSNTTAARMMAAADECPDCTGNDERCQTCHPDETPRDHVADFLDDMERRAMRRSFGYR